MKSSTKRILSIALSGVFFIATLVVYGNLIRPEFELINKKRSLVSAKSNLFENQKVAVGQVQSLIGRLQSVGQLKQTVAKSMPEGPSVTDVLNQIQAIARESQAELKSFSLNPGVLLPSNQPLVKRMGSLSLQVSVIGTYESVKEFLRGLETNVRVANVEDLAISPIQRGGSQSGENIFNMALKVVVFYQE